jgi:OOP family OmpA-OmpF porin
MRALSILPLVCVAALVPAVVWADGVSIAGGQLEGQGTIAFEADAAAPTEGSGAALDAIARFIAEKTYLTTLRVEGHVAHADAKRAQALSEARARAIGAALVARGVDCKRLVLVGFGDTKPVAARDTLEGRAANTRVVFAPAGLRGRAIGGLPLDGGGQVAGAPCAPR